MMRDGYSITLEEVVLLDRAVYRGVQNGEIASLATLLHELVHVAQHIEGVTPWTILRSYIETLGHDRSQFEIHECGGAGARAECANGMADVGECRWNRDRLPVRFHGRPCRRHDDRERERGV